MTNVYNENSIKTLDYRNAVRQSIGMYIGANDLKGMQHLLTEIIANSIDEAAAGYGNKIIVEIDTEQNQVTITDYGRGLPFKKNAEGHYAIIEACTNLHSGGKFEGQDNYKSSLGLNGVGLTVVNGLSSYFEIRSCREGEACIFKVIEGQFNEIPEIMKVKAQNGTTVVFIPDASIFKNEKGEPYQWDISAIKEELQLHALLNNGITFTFIVDQKVEATYLYHNGVKDMLILKTEGLKMLTDQVIFSTVTKNDSGTTCQVEMALAYSDKAYETIYSFVNGGYTPNNGTHVTGFKSAYTSLINKIAREGEFIKDKEKNLSGDIIRKGLVLILSIHLSERPLFAEQTKLTLNSPSARALVSKAVGQLTFEKAVLKQIMDKIMVEQKAEEAAQRKREAQEKIARGGKSMNSLRDLPEKLADASDFNDAELFLVEGDSAAGGAKETKTASQAVLPLRGKIKNCSNLELADVIKSDTIKDLLVTLGCGVGDNFNLTNLRYNRIIIMTDADPDGGHIELLLITLFLHHLPDLITQGKVFAAVSPLYKTKTAREEKYWYPDQEKEYKKYIKTHSVNTITRFKGLGELNPEELFETTMNPSTRRLIPLTTENLDEILELYDRLMGKQPSLRRDFILKNKLSSIEDADLFEDGDDVDIE